MMSAVAESGAKLPAYFKWFGLYYVLVVLLTVLPTILNAVDVQWLPSPAFALQARLPAILVGLATSLSFLMLFLHLKTVRKVTRDARDTPATLLACLILAVCGYYSTITSVPLAAAMVAGEEMDMSFVVRKVSPFQVKYCGRAVELEFLSPHYGTLCGLSPAFADSLTPGARIVVSGRGTSWGLVVKSARLR